MTRATPAKVGPAQAAVMHEMRTWHLRPICGPTWCHSARSGYRIATATNDPVYKHTSPSGPYDAALVVGSKLGAERTGRGRLPLPTALAQIDVDPAEIGRTYPVAVSIVADARLALEALLDALGDVPREWPSRRDEAEATRDAVCKHARDVFGASLAMLDAVRDALPREGVVVADTTMLGYASAQYLPVYEPRTYIHPSELCTIGCRRRAWAGWACSPPEPP